MKNKQVRPHDPSLKRSNWTENEIKLAKGLDIEGWSTGQIAAHLNRSFLGVKRKLEVVKIHGENKPDEIVSMLAPTQIKLPLKPVPERDSSSGFFTDKEMRIILRLAGYYTTDEIVKKLHDAGSSKTKKQIYQKLWRLHSKFSHTLAGSANQNKTTSIRPVGNIKSKIMDKQKVTGKPNDEKAPHPAHWDDDHWQNQKVDPMSGRHVELKTWHKPRINLSNSKKEPLSLKPRDIVPEPMVQVTSTEMNTLLKAVEGLRPTEEPKKKGFFRRLFSG
tara:strand:+ start:190 stop:1014 length:825 start_codon:yes stop_codon:yes gene_type:complete